jgi:Uma2 family endonuclease
MISMDTVVLKDSVTTRMSDQEFYRFCVENPQLRIERKSNFQVVITAPVSTLSSYSSGQAFAQLAQWNSIMRQGIVFDSSAGFTLPDRSVLSPDASWLSLEKWRQLREDEKNSFAPAVPEFVIEVRSKSDSMTDLKEKMRTWIRNGALSGWLIDPIEKRTFRFRQGGEVTVVEGFESTINGEGPLYGFTLHLSALLQP